MKWDVTKLGDHCTITSSKRCYFSQRVTQGIPFYRSKEIIQIYNGQEIIESDYISFDQYNQIKEKFGVPQNGDLLLTTRGTIGIPYIYKKTDRFYFADGNLTWMKGFSEQLCHRFLYYWFISYEGASKIDSIAVGAAQKAVPIAGLKNMQLPLPPIFIQHRIADILSAYDDLIENNQKQIKLLEEAAMRLYKEWFVNLRFPEYENTPIVDGVPAGWQQIEIGNVIGKTKRTKQIKTAEILSEGKIPVVDQGREFIAGYTNDEEALVDLPIPVIIFGDHTRILKLISFPFAKGADGTQLIVSNNICMPQHLFFCSLVNIDLSNYHYARHFKYLKAEKILLPSQIIADSFENMVSKFYEQVQSLKRKIINLQRIRNALLPKLMNGEIEV